MQRTYSIEGGDNASYGVQFGPVRAAEVGECCRQPFGGPFLLLRVLDELTIQDDPVEFLALAPRYVGDTLETIRESGGVVAVYRILAGVGRPPADAMRSGEFRTVAVGAATPKA